MIDHRVQGIPVHYQNDQGRLISWPPISVSGYSAQFLYLPKQREWKPLTTAAIMAVLRGKVEVHDGGEGLGKRVQEHQSADYRKHTTLKAKKDSLILLASDHYQDAETFGHFEHDLLRWNCLQDWEKIFFSIPSFTIDTYTVQFKYFGSGKSEDIHTSDAPEIYISLRGSGSLVFYEKTETWFKETGRQFLYKGSRHPPVVSLDPKRNVVEHIPHAYRADSGGGLVMVLQDSRPIQTKAQPMSIWLTNGR